jgi:hypothetical protein
MAAASIPQGVHGSNHRHSRLVVPGTFPFSHGRQQSNEEHRKEQILVMADAMWIGLFEFTYENAWLGRGFRTFAQSMNTKMCVASYVLKGTAMPACCCSTSPSLNGGLLILH